MNILSIAKSMDSFSEMTFIPKQKCKIHGAGNGSKQDIWFNIKIVL